MKPELSTSSRKSFRTRSAEPPPTRDAILAALRRELPALREQYGVEEMALFGSYATGQATARSDVDLIVSFRRPPGLAFVELAERLEHILGRRVDLITSETIAQGMRSPRHRRIALAIQETLIYA